MRSLLKQRRLFGCRSWSPPTRHAPRAPKSFQHRSEQSCVNAGLAFHLSSWLHARRAGHAQLPGAASSVEITFMQMWLKKQKTTKKKKRMCMFLREKLLCYLWKVISFELKGKYGRVGGMSGGGGGGGGFSLETNDCLSPR